MMSRARERIGAPMEMSGWEKVPTSQAIEAASYPPTQRTPPHPPPSNTLLPFPITHKPPSPILNPSSSKHRMLVREREMEWGWRRERVIGVVGEKDGMVVGVE